LHAELKKRTYDIVIRNVLWLAGQEQTLALSTAHGST